MQKVFYRGSVPCDVLFVGEAPGDTELVLREPFVGPSGRYLDRVINQVLKDHGKVTTAFTNAIACAPLEEETLRFRPPKKSEISSCSPRLQEFVNLCDPSSIVCLGATAKKAIAKIDTEAEVFFGIHPSAILRQGERGALDSARLTAVITDAVTKVLQHG